MLKSSCTTLPTKQGDPRLLACQSSLKALVDLSPSEQESIVDWVISNKDWSGEFNVIHNTQELLCQSLRHALQGYREFKHTAMTKPGPFDLELAVIRHYIKQNPPYEVFATLKRIETPEQFKKDKALTHKALFTDLFGSEEASKAFKWYPDSDNALSF